MATKVQNGRPAVPSPRRDDSKESHLQDTLRRVRQESVDYRQKMEAELQTSELTCLQYSNTIMGLQGEVESLNKSLSDANVHTHNVELLLANARQKIVEFQQKCDDWAQKDNGNVALLSDRSNQIASLKNDLSQAETRRKNLAEQVKVYKKHNKVRKEIIKLQREIETLSRRLRDNEDEQNGITIAAAAVGAWRGGLFGAALGGTGGLVGSQLSYHDADTSIRNQLKTIRAAIEVREKFLSGQE